VDRTIWTAPALLVLWLIAASAPSGSVVAQKQPATVASHRSTTDSSLPDIAVSCLAVAGKQLPCNTSPGRTVANDSAPSANTLELDPGSALAMSDGRCLFPVAYTIENLGGRPTGSFYIRVEARGSRVFTSLTPFELPAGARRRRTVQLWFTPGISQVIVAAYGPVEESTTENNATALFAEVRGGCDRSRNH
jgi:hypothetical protein